MGSRWLNATIVLFWMSTMSWLIWEKVLPPLLHGQPPTYEAMLPAADAPSRIQVGWKVFWNGRPVGTAIGRINRGQDRFVEVEHHLRLHGFPLHKAIPVGGMFHAEDERLGTDVDSKMTFDKFNRLLSFHSSVAVGKRKGVIRVDGTLAGDVLETDLSGDVSASTERRLPRGALAGDPLSPLILFRGLQVGEEWAVPVFTYFDTGETIEILHVKVDREHIDWNGRRVNTLLVVYRTDPASGLGQGDEVRRKLWVRQEDGAVLQQSIRLLGNWLKFVRTADAQPQEADDPTDPTKADSPT